MTVVSAWGERLPVGRLISVLSKRWTFSRDSVLKTEEQNERWLIEAGASTVDTPASIRGVSGGRATQGDR